MLTSHRDEIYVFIDIMRRLRLTGKKAFVMTHVVNRKATFY